MRGGEGRGGMREGGNGTNRNLLLTYSFASISLSSTLDPGAVPQQEK